MDGRTAIETLNILGSFSQLSQVVNEHQVDRIIVALDDRRGTLPVADLVRCKFCGISIDDCHTIKEELTGKILTEGLYPSWLIFSDGFNQSQILLKIKRLMDIFLSAVMLIFSLPLILLTMAAIKLDSPGSILYVQKRVGEREKIFHMYKFRSMLEDAEKECGPTWCQEDDDRITKVGAIIRRFRIDELPQLYNILRGDMSFVGPRPERPEFVEKLKKIIPYYSERFAIKPGLTGWAQINYQYGASVKDAIEKLEYDLYYIKHLSILIDVVIVFHTIRVVLLRIGSR